MLSICQDGWAAEAARIPSPNFSARPPGAEVLLAVLHGISLPPGEFGGDDVARLFCNELDCAAHPAYDDLRGLRVSAHFFIRRGGELAQFVSCADAAWHAGESIWRGRARCNDFSIGIELEGADAVAYAPPQYDTLARLLGGLAAVYPAICVAGHSDIAPGRKTDPGDFFDWQKVFAAAGKERDGRAAA